jgi:AcrR family transcriptional regulator
VAEVRPRVEERDSDIIDAVIRLLEAEGYEAVQVRRVAAEASVSLATLYRLYGSRDELIIRALERWMQESAYAGLDALPTTDTVEENLTAILHTVFARWERQPHMLVAFIRARLSPNGIRLQHQGLAAVEPRALLALADIDPDLLADLSMITEHVLLAALARFAAGEIEVSEIVTMLDRTIRRVLSAAREQDTSDATRAGSTRRRPKAT